MAAEDIQSLTRRLNPLCRSAFEAAVQSASRYTHFSVEIEHWLSELASAPSGDWRAILRHFGLDGARIIDDIRADFEIMKRGARGAVALAPGLRELLREASVVSQLDFGGADVRSGHVLYALLASEKLAVRAELISRTLTRLSSAKLLAEFAEATQGSTESPAGPERVAGAQGDDRTEAGPLQKYCTDLTAAAREGKIDPVIGRDAEIRQMMDVLLRRRQNNPILTGEAGVGKTAVVEGLALRLAAGEAPEQLKPVRLLALDLALLQAGAGVKGEFEHRLKAVVQAVKDSPDPIVMFIDEAHTLVGAGGAEGQGDAANILKPALARGEMRTVAATTWSEYKQYFEKDPALTRRFQVIKVEEPTEDVATAMLRATAPVLERHHKVRILNEGVEAAVRLSTRYIAGRQLPDKAISLLDTAASRVSLSQSATPGPVEDERGAIAAVEMKMRALAAERDGGDAVEEALAALSGERDAAQERLSGLERRLAEERAMIAEILELRRRAAAGEQLAGAITDRTAALRALQGDNPMAFEAVDAECVAQIVSDWTGIPVGRMARDEIDAVLALESRLRARIRGQEAAIRSVSEEMRIARARLNDMRKPVAAFLFFGTSGVGKTETALALSEQMFGGEAMMTTINMSEFKEEHKVSMLLGAPPGYVGFGQGGVLTEAIRRRPYGVVLLDEIEKAHPGVQDVFYQVFDRGMLKDGQGRDIDCRNCVFVLTSNAATDIIEKLCVDPETAPDADGLAAAARGELLKTFKPAFLGRLKLVPFLPLGRPVIREISALSLARLGARLREGHGAAFEWTEAVVDHIAESCTESQSGARNVENIVKRRIAPQIAERVLSGVANGEKIISVAIDIDKKGTIVYEMRASGGK